MRARPISKDCATGRSGRRPRRCAQHHQLQTLRCRAWQLRHSPRPRHKQPRCYAQRDVIRQRQRPRPRQQSDSPPPPPQSAGACWPRCWRSLMAASRPQRPLQLLGERQRPRPRTPARRSPQRARARRARDRSAGARTGAARARAQPRARGSGRCCPGTRCSPQRLATRARCTTSSRPTRRRPSPTKPPALEGAPAAPTSSCAREGAAGELRTERDLKVTRTHSSE